MQQITSDDGEQKEAEEVNGDKQAMKQPTYQEPIIEGSDCGRALYISGCDLH